MIKKPEDAIPHFGEIGNWRNEPNKPSENCEVFTTKDCAEIARAYGRAYHEWMIGNVNIMPMAPPEPYEEWDAKFLPWEK